MKFHGQYCGPNWSDGKHQLSVAFGQPAVDELDQLCKDHDAVYATSTDPVDLAKADKAFALRALSLGWPKAVVAGIAVGAQAMYRAVDNYIAPNNTMTKNNRRTQAVLAPQYPTMRLSLPGQRSAPPKPTLNKRLAKMSATSTIPAAYTTTSRMDPPTSASGVDNGVCLKHRGLVSSFTGSTNFGASNWQVNPGMGSVFPWAAQLARSYDKYRFKKLRFEYRAVCPTTTAGVVMMSFDFDTLDTLPTTKFEHAQTTPNVESNSYHNFALDVKCDNVWRFTRQGAKTDVDLKTYDLGQLVVSSSYGVAALIGEVYVDYEVELTKPSYGTPVFQRIGCVGAAATPFSTISQDFGTAKPFDMGSTSALVCSRPGEYIISMYAQGVGMGAFTLPTIPVPSAGATVGTTFPILVSAAATAAVATVRVRIGARDVLNFANVFAGSTNIVLVISEAEYTFAA